MITHKIVRIAGGAGWGINFGWHLPGEGGRWVAVFLSLLLWRAELGVWWMPRQPDDTMGEETLSERG